MLKNDNAYVGRSLSSRQILYYIRTTRSPPSYIVHFDFETISRPHRTVQKRTENGFEFIVSSLDFTRDDFSYLTNRARSRHNYTKLEQLLFY